MANHFVKLGMAIFACLSLVATVAEAAAIHNSYKVNVRDTKGSLKHCMLMFLYQDFFGGNMYGKFTADCYLDLNDESTGVASTIDLNHCLANYDNNLVWAKNGGAFASCKNCHSRQFETQYIDCDCACYDYVTDNHHAIPYVR